MGRRGWGIVAFMVPPQILLVSENQVYIYHAFGHVQTIGSEQLYDSFLLFAAICSTPYHLCICSHRFYSFIAIFSLCPVCTRFTHSSHRSRISVRDGDRARHSEQITIRPESRLSMPSLSSYYIHLTAHYPFAPLSRCRLRDRAFLPLSLSSCGTPLLLSIGEIHPSFETDFDSFNCVCSQPVCFGVFCRSRV